MEPNDAKEKYTPISSLGEFGLIRHLTKNIIHHQSSTIQGVGDDAAVIESPGADEYVLLSTDMLVEGIHFDLAYSPLKHLGYKAVSANVSDICAMNGIPTQIVISIAVSNHFSVESLEEFYKGIYFACEDYKVDLVGGDTVSSRSGFIINVSILGKVNKKNAVYRKGAKEGDCICVSGDLGAAYAGLLVLQKSKKSLADNSETKPDLSSYEYVLKRQLMPKARTDLVELFQSLDIIPTSMIDVSDGLSSELNHICESSGTGCIIYEDNIPIHKNVKKVAEEFQNLPIAYALSGGEDYELLFTVSPTGYEMLKHSGKVSCIGGIKSAAEGIGFKDKTGKVHPLGSKGWDAFNKIN